MDLKSWETLNYFKLELDGAVKKHNEAIAALYRNNQPLYADSIMRERATAARKTLTAKLDELAEKVNTVKAQAEATTSAAMDDQYAWLSDSELQRAALLRPFVEQDVAALGLEGMAQLSMEVKTGKRTFPRSTAWLLMREADRLNAPTDSFTRLALPEDAAKAEQEAEDAHLLGEKIERARPEWRERAMQAVVHHNYDATGEMIAA